MTWGMPLRAMLRSRVITVPRSTCHVAHTQHRDPCYSACTTVVRPSHKTRPGRGAPVRSFQRSWRARNLTANGTGNRMRGDPMHAWAEAPDELAQRIEEKLSQLDRFGLGSVPQLLLEWKRRAPKPSPPPRPPPAAPRPNPPNRDPSVAKPLRPHLPR